MNIYLIKELCFKILIHCILTPLKHFLVLKTKGVSNFIIDFLMQIYEIVVIFLPLVISFNLFKALVISYTIKQL